MIARSRWPAIFCRRRLIAGVAVVTYMQRKLKAKVRQGGFEVKDGVEQQ
jgi:hypothetical protein